MGSRKDAVPFEFPSHLREWSPHGELGHFAFHKERCQVAPRALKLPEIQRMTDCDMCPNKGRGGPSGPHCRCAYCAEHFPEKENDG